MNFSKPQGPGSRSKPARRRSAAGSAALIAMSAFATSQAFAQDSSPHVIARNIDLNSLDPHRAFYLILAYRSDVKGVRYSACCNLPLAEISHCGPRVASRRTHDRYSNMTRKA